jgi:RluA family pseudouridine synthase
LRINGRVVRLCSWQVANGDSIEITRPTRPKPAPPTAFDERWVITHESDLIAMYKPAGLRVEPVRAGDRGNLLALAQERYGPLHLFHRLDRDTSGVVLLTLGGEIDAQLDAAFKQREVVKEYVAVVAAPNDLPPEAVIRQRLAPHPRRRDMMRVVARGGQAAITRFCVIAENGDRMWLRVWPVTGRTHQIRIHLAHLGAPVLGDRLYGDVASAERLLLHARRIDLPALGERGPRTYTAPLPECMRWLGMDSTPDS